MKTRPKAACDAGEFAIYVSIYSARLENLTDVLAKRNGHWTITGRAGVRNEAAEFQHPAGRGVRGTSEVGCYGKAKGYEGAAETDVAYVETKKHVVEFVADVNLAGLEGSPFDSIVSSLRIGAPSTGSTQQPGSAAQ